MLGFLRDSDKLCEPKARLFPVAVCRRFWHLLTEERARRAIEVTERYTGLASKNSSPLTGEQMHEAPQQQQRRTTGRRRAWLALGVVSLILLPVGGVFVAGQSDPGGPRAAHARVREGMTQTEVLSVLPVPGSTAKA